MPHGFALAGQALGAQRASSVPRPALDSTPLATRLPQTIRPLAMGQFLPNMALTVHAKFVGVYNGGLG